MKNYIKILFPFLITLLLWRLDSLVFNPCGILAIIPLFYYSFVRPVLCFFPFSLLICLLIDRNFDTLLFWTFMYSAAYAANGLQSFFDTSRQKMDALFVFMAFFGLCLLILTFWSSVNAWSWGVLLKSIWLLLWVSVFYFIFAAIAKRIDK